MKKTFLVALVIILQSSVCFSGADKVLDPNTIVGQNLTTDPDGLVRVYDYNDKIGLIQKEAYRSPNLMSGSDLRKFEKTRRIRVSRGGVVTLNGVTWDQVRKDKRAQLLILELKKINLAYEKADLLQQYVWNDHALNDRIWQLDLEMATIDASYVPWRGAWNENDFGFQFWLKTFKHATDVIGRFLTKELYIFSIAQHLENRQL